MSHFMSYSFAICNCSHKVMGMWRKMYSLLLKGCLLHFPLYLFAIIFQVEDLTFETVYCLP